MNNAIVTLSAKINQRFGSNVTPAMLTHCLGENVTEEEVERQTQLTLAKSDDAVTPWDIFDSLDENSDYGLVDED